MFLFCKYLHNGICTQFSFFTKQKSMWVMRICFRKVHCLTPRNNLLKCGETKGVDVKLFAIFISWQAFCLGICWYLTSGVKTKYVWNVHITHHYMLLDIGVKYYECFYICDNSSQPVNVIPFLKSGRKVTGYAVTFRHFMCNAAKLEVTGKRSRYELDGPGSESRWV